MASLGSKDLMLEVMRSVSLVLPFYCYYIPLSPPAAITLQFDQSSVTLTEGTSSEASPNICIVSDREASFDIPVNITSMDGSAESEYAHACKHTGIDNWASMYKWYTFNFFTCTKFRGHGFNYEYHTNSLAKKLCIYSMIAMLYHGNISSHLLLIQMVVITRM